MSIALLANVTATSIAMRVNRVTREEVFYPHGYNTWLQELAANESSLYRSGARAVFILLHGPELLREEGLQSSEAAEAALTPYIETIASAAAAHRDTTFVVSTLDIPQRRIMPLIAQRPEQHACTFWRERLQEHELPILELSEIVTGMGRDRFYNDRVWYMGSIPYSQSGEEALADEIRRIWNALRGTCKKCLALDLDNTLWGGVIGEMGVEGIHLDTVGSGARYYDFQKRILDLKRQGTLLAVISKNNRDDAMAGISEHPNMLLRETDFVAIRANWSPKPDNLASIAEELNIGTDSFVFIDDNPVEREIMRLAMPEVEVPDFPEDTSQLEKFMTDVAREYFLQLRTTGEDTAKTEQYRAENAREERRKSFTSVREYLMFLEMALSIEALSEQNLPRAAQLTQKTNQFNLTTKRYSEADMRALLLTDEKALVRIGGLRDRFGDYGKVILCIAKIDIGGATALIDTFLMSCRVMGREVEETFLKSVESELQMKGVRSVTAQYVPTAKNALVSEFWERMGYTKIGGKGAQYAKDISQTAEAATDEIMRIERE